MTRQEAIDNLMGAWYRGDYDRCITSKECAECEIELRECLHAVGVTDEEMGWKVEADSVKPDFQV